MKIYAGGVNAVGKSTVLKQAASKLGFGYVHATTELMDYLGFDGDYEKLRALTQHERNIALAECMEHLLEKDESCIVDGHYLGLVRGEMNTITGPWIKGFDRLILISAPTEDIWNRLQKDKRDRALFPEGVPEEEKKELLQNYQAETREEFRRLGEVHSMDGLELLNSENNLEETVQNLTEYVEKYA